MTEGEIIEYLNFSKNTFAEKAKKLGYKRTSINTDAGKVSGWKNGDSFFRSSKKLVNHHKRYPFGFDYYFWGWQLKQENSG